MTMGRKPAGVITNGHNQIRWPGAYRHVLREVCAEEVREPYAWLCEEADDAVWTSRAAESHARRPARGLARGHVFWRLSAGPGRLDAPADRFNYREPR